MNFQINFRQEDKAKQYRNLCELLLSEWRKNQSIEGRKQNFQKILMDHLNKQVDKKYFNNLLRQSSLHMVLFREYGIQIESQCDIFYVNIEKDFEDIQEIDDKLAIINYFENLAYEILDSFADTEELRSKVKKVINECPMLKNIRTAKGVTYLVLAAHKNFSELLEFLIDECQCSINLRSGEIEWSALTQAAVDGRMECFRILLDRKANFTLKDNKGKTAIDYAILNPSLNKYLTDTIKAKSSKNSQIINTNEIQYWESLAKIFQKSSITTSGKLILVLEDDDYFDNPTKLREKLVEIKWHFFDESYKLWHPFKDSESKQLEDLLERGKKQADISTVERSCKIRFDEFTAEFQAKGIIQFMKIRYIGIPSRLAYFMNLEDKGAINRLKWELFYFPSQDQVDILELSRTMSNKITKSFFEQQSQIEIQCEFPEILKAKKKIGRDRKASNTWTIKINLQNFEFFHDDYDLKGFVRWLPRVPTDYEEILQEKDTNTYGKKFKLTDSSISTSLIDEEEDEDDPMVGIEDGKSFLKTLKKASLISDGNNSRRNIEKEFNSLDEEIDQDDDENKKAVFKNKGPLRKKLLTLFPEGIKDIQVGDNDLIVKGPETFKKQVNHAMSLLIESIKPENIQNNGIVTAPPLFPENVIEIVFNYQSEEYKSDITKWLNQYLSIMKDQLSHEFSPKSPELILRGKENLLQPIKLSLDLKLSELIDQKTIHKERLIGMADLADRLMDIMILDKPIKALKDGRDLIVYGTNEQINDIRSNVQLYTELLKHENDSVKKFKKSFKGIAYLIDELKSINFIGPPLYFMQNGQDLEIEGTNLQLQDIQNRLEEIKLQYAQKSTQTYIEPGMGYLAPFLKENDMIKSGIKYRVLNNVNLEFTCTQDQYENLKIFLNVAKILHEDRTRLTSIKNQLHDKEHDTVIKTYNFPIVSEKYMLIIIPRLYQISQDIKEYKYIDNVNMEFIPSVECTKADYLIIKFKGNSNQARKFEEEVKRIDKVREKILALKERYLLETNKFIKRYDTFLEYSKSYITSKNAIRYHYWIEFITRYRNIFNDICEEQYNSLEEKLEELYKAGISNPNVTIPGIMNTNNNINNNNVNTLAKKKSKGIIIVENDNDDDVVEQFIQKLKKKFQENRTQICNQIFSQIKSGTIKAYRQKQTKETPISQQAIQTFNELFDPILKTAQNSLTTIGIKSNNEKASIEELKQNAIVIQDKLYQASMLCKGMLLNLPIFENIKEFFTKLASNRVVMIKAGTGSGKSTLIPPLLVAMGYKKIVVTQPRRFPCRAISQRVNTTFDELTSGWVISGASKLKNNPLIYMTDGLLKEILISLAGDQTFPFDVIMLDEVHERSSNVDICIALLALCILNSKYNFKVILCSATIDPDIMNMFNSVSTATFEVQIPNRKIEEKICLDAHPIYLAHEISAELEGDEQLLVFLPGMNDVNEAVKLFRKEFKKTAYPLYSTQNPKLQEEYINHGSIFFSTTIAETSLTFRNLKFVIDSGKVKMPVYDRKKKALELKEMLAPSSSRKQRKGRLGRLNKIGIYYLCVDSKLDIPLYNASELERIGLTDIIFTLLRSKKDLTFAENVLNRIPIKDTKTFKEKISIAYDELQKLGIIDLTGKNKRITSEGLKILELPVTGEAKMSKALYAALTKYSCGLDLLIICSFCMVAGLLISDILKNLPNKYISPKGDFDSLINLMSDILEIRRGLKFIDQFNVAEACETIGINNKLIPIEVIKRWYNKFYQYEKIFANTSDLKEYKLTSQLKSTTWENVAKALLEGYYDHVFVNLQYLGGDSKYYIRLSDNENDSNNENDPINNLTLDFSSKLSTKKNDERSLIIIAKNLSYNSSQLEGGVISMAGRLDEVKGFITLQIKRKIHFNPEADLAMKEDASDGLPYEIQLDRINKYINNRTNIFNITNLNEVIIAGPLHEVIEHEAELDKLLRAEKKIIDIKKKLDKLIQGYSVTQKRIVEENYKKLKNSRFEVFNPLRSLWKFTNNVDINYYQNDDRFTIKNVTPVQFKEISKVINDFLNWFKGCNAIRTEDSKCFPKALDKVKVPEFKEIEERIEKITNPNKTKFQLMEYAYGGNATRVTRMQLTAWILINKFDCTIEGGFVRDWIVRGHESWPKNINPPSSLLVLNPRNNRLDILNDTVSPKDLDVHLSPREYFDPQKFRQELYKYGIEVEIDHKDGWRYYAIFDRDAPTGPFTADLIESFVHICHDMIDMDVSNLYIKTGFTKELGLRIPLDNVKMVKADSAKINITLEDIVRNCLDKRFRVLRADIRERIDKMKNRGWTQDPELYEIVVPQEIPLTFMPVIRQADDDLWKHVAGLFTRLQGIQIVKIHSISSLPFDKIYEGQRDIIKLQNDGQANEKILFHGTSQQGAEGISQGSFDSRYYKNGAWGYGAYFADDPNKSHGYAAPAADGTRCIFVCKVLLGKELVLNAAKQGMVAPPPGYHSVRGAGFQFMEYIVYWFGQAKPIFLVIYKQLAN